MKMLEGWTSGTVKAFIVVDRNPHAIYALVGGF